MKQSPRLATLVVVFVLSIATRASALDIGRTSAILLKERIVDNIGFNYNHPGAMAELRDGTLVATALAGPEESDANSYWLSRKPPGGAWSFPVWIEPNFGAGSVPSNCPVLFQPRKAGAPLIFWYLWGGKTPNGKGVYRYSQDGGLTWTARTNMAASSDPWFRAHGGQMMGPTQNAPIETPDGSLLGAIQSTGSYLSPPYGVFAYDHWRSGFLRIPANNYSSVEPGGTAWSPVLWPAGVGSGFGGSVLVISADHQKLGLVVRGAQEGANKIARSTDGGKTWSAFEFVKGGGTAGVGSVSLDVGGGPANGWHVLVSSGRVERQNRNGLDVWVSNDTASWTQALTLDAEAEGEDADPSVFQGADRKVHVRFTGRGKNFMSHVVLDPDKLIASSAPSFAGTLQFIRGFKVGDFNNGAISSNGGYLVNEKAGAAMIAVRRTGGSAGTVTVQYGASDDTARAGQDFTATTGTLTWAPGDTADKVFSIPITDDPAVEGAERVRLALSNPGGGASILSQPTSELWIMDDDTPTGGVVQFTQAVYHVAETMPFVAVELMRTGNMTAVGGAIGVVDMGGTATAGVDFTPSAFKTSWPIGNQETTSWQIPIKQDTTAEGNESFTIRLTGFTGTAAGGTMSTATVVIIDSNAGPGGTVGVPTAPAPSPGSDASAATPGRGIPPATDARDPMASVPGVGGGTGAATGSSPTPGNRSAKGCHVATGENPAPLGVTLPFVIILALRRVGRR